MKNFRLFSFLRSYSVTKSLYLLKLLYYCGELLEPKVLSKFRKHFYLDMKREKYQCFHPKLAMSRKISSRMNYLLFAIKQPVSYIGHDKNLLFSFSHHPNKNN